jgi:hypothetical protein
MIFKFIYGEFYYKLKIILNKKLKDHLGRG